MVTYISGFMNMLGISHLGVGKTWEMVHVHFVQRLNSMVQYALLYIFVHVNITLKKSQNDYT